MTQSHCPAPSQPSDAPSLVSSLRLTRRSEGGVVLVGLWGRGPSTLRNVGLTRSAVEPGMWANHCLMEGEVLGQRGLALPPFAWKGEVVLEGSGRAAPLGAQAASWGEARDLRFSFLGLLAGVLSVWLKDPMREHKIHS